MFPHVRSKVRPAIIRSCILIMAAERNIIKATSLFRARCDGWKKETHKHEGFKCASKFYITQNNSIYGGSMLSFNAADWVRENKDMVGGSHQDVTIVTRAGKVWRWGTPHRFLHLSFSPSGWQLNVYHMQYLFSSCVRLSSCPREYKECHLLE